MYDVKFSVFFFFFFFSSRRRHTRYIGDWSSDVCSSDLNGTRLGEYKGGYTPFTFELTQHVDFDRDNVLAVEVDSSERPDIPPFGNEIDYLTFGGIYREVSLRVVSPTYIENIFA